MIMDDEIKVKWVEKISRKQVLVYHYIFNTLPNEKILYCPILKVSNDDKN